MKKILVVGVVLLFLGSSIPVLAQSDKNSPAPLSHTLYVGGSGPGNYTKIQDAINASSDGDTVFVFNDSSPYFEHIIINKSINLWGEGRKTTVIDGMGEGATILVNKSNVIIQGFTITGNSRDYGIYLKGHGNCKISNNSITNCAQCIEITNSSSNFIGRNFIQPLRNLSGLELSRSFSNEITENIFCGGYLGIYILYASRKNFIEKNLISCTIGVWIDSSFNNLIKMNNFNDSTPGFSYCSRNHWDENYWGRPRIYPYIIQGDIYEHWVDGIFIFSIPWINID